MKKGTPPVGGTTNGASGGSNLNPNHNHNGAFRDIPQEMVIDIFGIVCGNYLLMWTSLR
jgi:hypothetical protein